MTDFLQAVLAYDFMAHALWAGVLASVLCGVLGTFVVVKRLVFISGGISHAAFGGLGLFYWLGLPPVLGAVGVAVASALLVGLTDNARVRSQDALIGVLWAVGMAVGILFIAITPGYAPNLNSYLFGNILTVTKVDVVMTAGLDGLVLAIVAVFYKELVAVAFDETFARVQGVPVRALTTLLLVLTGLTVVVLIQVVGIILVIALLTLPPVTALMLSRDFSRVMLLSVGIGLLLTVGGLALSYTWDLPAGPAIILLGTALLGGVYGVQGYRRR